MDGSIEKSKIKGKDILYIEREREREREKERGTCLSNS